MKANVNRYGNSNERKFELKISHNSHSPCYKRSQSRRRLQGPKSTLCSSHLQKASHHLFVGSAINKPWYKRTPIDRSGNISDTQETNKSAEGSTFVVKNVSVEEGHDLINWYQSIRSGRLTTTEICNDQIWTTSFEPIHDYLNWQLRPVRHLLLISCMIL